MFLQQYSGNVFIGEFLLITYHCLFKNMYDVSNTNIVSIWRKKERVSSVLEPNRYSGFFVNLKKNNIIYLLQLGFNPVAVVILHVYKTWNWLLLNLVGRATWEACSGNLESWEPSQHLLLGTGKPRKTCIEMAGRMTFRILTSSQQSGI